MQKVVMGSAVMVAFFMIGCGGGATTSNGTDTVQKSTGYYVDAKVKGAHYKCGAFEGNTTEEGEFTYELSKGCIFSLGGLRLREVNASVLEEHNITILEDDERVARMLQSIDTDGNTSNGIQLPDEVVTILTENNVTEIPTEEAELAELLYELRIKAKGFRGSLVSKDEAREHLRGTRQHLGRHHHRTQHGYLDYNETDDTVDTNETNAS